VKPIHRLLVATLIAAVAVTSVHAQQAKPKMASDIPPEITTPSKVDTPLGTLEFFDSYSSKNTVQKVYDNLDFMRGVEVFLNAMPGASLYAMREGFRHAGAADNTFLIFETLMDSKSLFLTPNTESVYVGTFYDLRTGPLVVEVPPNVLGAVQDMWFRYVIDVGNAGPDRGKGGKYVLLPPSYQGAVPQGYFVANSRTYSGLMFYRGFVVNGDPKPAVDAARQYLRLYPLAQAANPPATTIVNVSGTSFNTVHANDTKFYVEVHALVQEEPVDAMDPETMGLLVSIGIEKGKPFAPDARLKKILDAAAATGNATARAISFRPRAKEAYIYPGESSWFTVFVGGSYEFLRNGVRNIDARTLFYYQATIVTPAMAAKMVGAGSQYAGNALDSKGEYLDGGKNYRLHLPPNIPAKNFWSMVLYDPQTRSMLQTDSQFPSLSSQTGTVKPNADGSYDLYFGPQPPAGKESNWLQTIPGKGWFVYLRLYGPLEPWFDKTWRPGEIELAH
jgi:hypothetical protein